MKRPFWMLGALALGACEPAPAHPMEWTEVTPVSEGRFEPLGVAVAGKLFVFGGFLTADTVSPRVDVYDPEADVWTRLADMPAPQTHAGIAVVGTDVHIVGGFLGFPSASQRSHWVYDTQRDTWTRRQDLPIGMAGHVLVHVENRLHAIGGFDEEGRGVTGDHRTFTLPDGPWEDAPPLPHPRDHLGGAVVGDRVFVVGGRHGWDEVFGHRGELHVFDVAGGTWSERAALPDARSEISYATLESAGALLTVGGSTPFVQPSDELWRFDPSAEQWSLFDRMPGRRKGVVAARMGNRLIVTQGSPSSTAPVGTTWSACCLP